MLEGGRRNRTERIVRFESLIHKTARYKTALKSSRRKLDFGNGNLPALVFSTVEFKSAGGLLLKGPIWEFPVLEA